MKKLITTLLEVMSFIVLVTNFTLFLMLAFSNENETKWNIFYAAQGCLLLMWLGLYGLYITSKIK